MSQANWYPLCVYARRRGNQASDAQDLTQGFIASLLQRNSIERAAAEAERQQLFHPLSRP